jgi:hypothetical protein
MKIKKPKDAEFLYFTLCSFADLLDLEGAEVVMDEFKELFPEHYSNLVSNTVKPTKEIPVLLKPKKC